MRNHAVLFIALLLIALSFGHAAAEKKTAKDAFQYLVECHPNPDVITIHLNTKIYSPLEMSNFYSIEGVTDVRTSLTIHVSKYEVRITKGAVFGWRKITSEVISILYKELDGKGPIVKMKSRKCSW